MKKRIISLFVVVALLMAVPVSSVSAQSVNVTKQFQKDKKVKKLLNDAGGWCMLRILDDGQKQVILNKKDKIQMAAYAAVLDQKYKSTDNGNKVTMKKKDLSTYYNYLFGTKWFAMNQIDRKNTPQKSSRTIYLDKKQNIHVNIGEWGDGGPLLKITNVKKNSYTYKLTAKMYISGGDSADYYTGKATFTLKKNAKSPYGYKIVSLYVRSK